VERFPGGMVRKDGLPFSVIMNKVVTMEVNLSYP
jgi:hypothetical protein